MDSLKQRAAKAKQLLFLFLITTPLEAVKLFTGRFLLKLIDDKYTRTLGLIMPNKDKDDYVGSVYCWGYLKKITRSRYLEIATTTLLGQVAPNAQVIALADKSLRNLLDYARPNRPFVLNFGSCT